MAYEGLPLIRATWVERYEESPISSWCDRFAPEEEQEVLDVFTQHLFRIRQEHQTETVGESYPEATERFFATEQEGFTITSELMAAGEQAITNMPMISESIGL